MKNITIQCDRCGKLVEGMIAMKGYSDQITAGYYDVTDGFWQQFQRKNESNICDLCMWSDPNYIKIYGDSNMKLYGK